MNDFFLFILKYDIYKKKLNLGIGKSGGTSSMYSILITKIIISMILIYFINELIHVLNREKVQTNIVTEKIFPRPAIHLSNKNFKFAFAVDSSNDILFNTMDLMNQYFTPFLYFYQRISNSSYYDGNITRELIPFKKCEKSDFNFSEEYINFNELEKYYCSENLNFSISGYYDEKNESSIVFRLEICQNSSEKQDCKSYEEIESALNGGDIIVYFQDNDVDCLDFNNPIKSSLKYNYFGPINLNNWRYEEIFLKSVEIYTDESFWNVNFVNNFTFQAQSFIKYI